MAWRYEKLRELGCGSFGKAWLVTDIFQKTKVVLKEIKISVLSDKEVDQALAEVMILAKCKHHNVIRYADAFVNKDDGTLNIAMEYADGGDLQKAMLLRQGLHFSRELVLDWFIQICFALKFIHSQHILHRDIKPQNIFLTSAGIVKLGDFGIAKVLQGTMDHALTTIGTPYYLSPEICQKQPYNYKSDIWATGCILYEMCCLRVPFDAPNFPSLVFKILGQKFQPIPTEFGPLVEDLIVIMLKIDPEERPSASEILNIPSLKTYTQKYLQKHRQALEGRKRKIRPETSKQKKADASLQSKSRPPAVSAVVMSLASCGREESPECKTPRKTPRCLPEKESSCSQTAENQTPHFEMAESKSPNFETPESQTHGFKTPESQTRGFKTPECKTPDFDSLECKTPDSETHESKTPEVTTTEKRKKEKLVHPALETLRRREENYKKFDAIANKENLPGKTFTIREQRDPKARRFSMVTPHLNELVKKQKTERKYMSVHRPVPKRPERVIQGPAPIFSLLRAVMRSQSFSGELPKIRGAGGRSYSVCGVLPMRRNESIKSTPSSIPQDDDCCETSFCSSMGDDDIFNSTASSVEAELRELQINTKTYSVYKGRRMSLIHSSPQSPVKAVKDIASSNQLQVLYNCLLGNVNHTNTSVAQLRSYLVNELGCEKFRELYNLILASVKTKSDFASLKMKAKEKIIYLPTVAMLLQLELNN